MGKQATQFRSGSPMLSTNKAVKKTSAARGKATPKTTFGKNSI